jgi:hypothetical protein
MPIQMPIRLPRAGRLLVQPLRPQHPGFLSKPQLPQELRCELEISLPVVWLVQDAEISRAKPDTPKTISASAAPNRLHQICAAHASFALGAVRTRKAPRATVAVGTLGAIDASVAVMRTDNAPTLQAERRIVALLATLAREATDVRGRRRERRHQLAQTCLELGPFHLGARE